MRFLKIFLSVLFVAAIGFFVVRSCAPKKVKRVLPPKTRVVLKKTPAPSPSAGKSGRIAFILDDWGKNYPLTRQASALDRPITLSILPNLSHSREIAEEAYRTHMGIMLHMPMQPESTSQPLEKQTILTTTSDAEILRYLDEALASVPHVEGVNNHMGSAATSDARVMKTVLSHLKKKNLFFIDSQVIHTTQGAKAAKESGVRFAKRDVFIDNEADLELIKVQISKALRVALTHGDAVVIGHDKRLTLQAIAEMIPEIEKAGVRLVYARDLVEIQ